MLQSFLDFTSPEDSSFKAVFSEMNIVECLWYAHDGQQPDSNLL